VSPPAANILLPSDLIEAAKSAMPHKAISANPEPKELSALFREHYQVIFRVAYRLTGSASDAEDVLQTIFLRLTPEQARRGLLPNPQGYLYRAAVNASVDLLRSRARARSVSLDVVDFDPSPRASVASPEGVLEDSELRELLRQAVAKLEGRAATAFTLRYYEGYDNADIAKVLGTSQMVVAVTLHRARTRLRKEIGNYLEKHHEAK
jgi:RNA polymerase sigma-70 factor, ECF subfamily